MTFHMIQHGTVQALTIYMSWLTQSNNMLQPGSENSLVLMSMNSWTWVWKFQNLCVGMQATIKNICVLK